MEELKRIFGRGRGQARLEELHGHRPFGKAAFNARSRRINTCVKGTLPTVNTSILLVHNVIVTSCQVYIKTQHTTQQQHAKPRHQPSDRDQQARGRLRNKVSGSKAKIKSRAYLQLGAKTLQIVHQTFDRDIPVILHLPALSTTMDTDTIPTLFVIQEGWHCMPTTDYYFANIQPDPITIPPTDKSVFMYIPRGKTISYSKRICTSHASGTSTYYGTV